MRRCGLRSRCVSASRGSNTRGFQSYEVLGVQSLVFPDGDRAGARERLGRALSGETSQ